MTFRGKDKKQKAIKDKGNIIPKILEEEQSAAKIEKINKFL